jgi:hypothetical protein
MLLCEIRRGIPISPADTKTTKDTKERITRADEVPYSFEAVKFMRWTQHLLDSNAPKDDFPVLEGP